MVTKAMHRAARAGIGTLLVLSVAVAAAECLAADKTITLQAPAAYSVPENEVWKVGADSIANGPSSDLEFKEARVYVGTTGKLDGTFFLLSGDFDVSLLKASGLSFFVQPGSKLRVGQRGPLKATVITMQK